MYNSFVTHCKNVSHLTYPDCFIATWRVIAHLVWTSGFRTNLTLLRIYYLFQVTNIADIYSTKATPNRKESDRKALKKKMGATFSDSRFVGDLDLIQAAKDELYFLRLVDKMKHKLYDPHSAYMKEAMRWEKIPNHALASKGLDRGKWVLNFAYPCVKCTEVSSIAGDIRISGCRW